MTRFLIDEHIPSAIVRQLQRSYPKDVDIARVVDTGLLGASDTEVLAWAAEEEHILISRDKATLTNFAYERIEKGLPMPGVIAVTRALAVGPLLEELALIIEWGKPEDFRDLVYYVP